MSLLLKIKKDVLNSGDKLLFTDVTGVYDVNNTGGWGTPNPNRNEIALMLYVKRIPYKKDPEVLSLDTPYISFDSAFDNDHQSVFEIPYKDDGWYQIYFIAIPLTYDTDEEGNVRYNVDQGELQIYSSGQWIPFDTDKIEEVLLTEDYDFSFEEEIFQINLINQKNCALENYVDCIQCTTCKCDQHFENHEKARITIQAVDYMFYSNKKFEAIRRLELANKEFKCCK